MKQDGIQTVYFQAGCVLSYRLLMAKMNMQAQRHYKKTKDETEFFFFKVLASTWLHVTWTTSSYKKLLHKLYFIIIITLCFNFRLLYFKKGDEIIVHFNLLHDCILHTVQCQLNYSYIDSPKISFSILNFPF